MIGSVIFGILVLGGMIAANIDYRYKIRDGNWHFYSGKFMRRRIGAEWQYRPTTESEALDWMDMHAW